MLTGEEAERIGPFNPGEFSKVELQIHSSVLFSAHLLPLRVPKAVYSYLGADEALAAMKLHGPPKFPTKTL